MNLLVKIRRKLLGDQYFKETRRIKSKDGKIYYIIRRVPLGEGFFSNYFYVLSHVRYALENGYFPVVDMQNYKTLYSEDEAINGTDNTWEYYFEAMKGIGLKEAYESDNYILSSGKYLSEMGVPVYEVNQGHITDEMVKNLLPVVKEYMTVKAEIRNSVEMFIEQNGLKDCQTVGVHVRGTDMHVTQKGHTLPPKYEKITEQIDSLIKQDNSIRIFLCTDEEKVVDVMKKQYGERIVCFDEYRASADDTSNKGLHKENKKTIRKHHRYLMGVEILKDALMLSKCDYLICGISNVTSAAVLFNGLEYREVRLIK